MIVKAVRFQTCLLALLPVVGLPSSQGDGVELFGRAQDAPVVGLRLEGNEVILFPKEGPLRAWSGDEVRELVGDEASKYGWPLSRGWRWVPTQKGDVVASARDRGAAGIELEFLPTGTSGRRRFSVEDLVRYCGAGGRDARVLGVEVLSAEGIGLRTLRGLDVYAPGSEEPQFSLPVAADYLGSPDGELLLLLEEKAARVFDSKDLLREITTPQRPRFGAFSANGKRLALLDATSLYVYRLSDDHTVEDEFLYSLADLSGDRVDVAAEEAPADGNVACQSADIVDAGARVAVAQLMVLQRPGRAADGSFTRGRARVTVTVLQGEDRERVWQRRFETDRWDHSSPRVRLSPDGALVVVLLPREAYGWRLP